MQVLGHEVVNACIAAAEGPQSLVLACFIASLGGRSTWDIAACVCEVTILKDSSISLEIWANS